MKWSYKIGKLLGIDVYIHFTFFLLLLWVFMSRLHQTSGSGILLGTISVAMTIVVFAVVTMHELGHAMACRRLGIGTRDIVLLPIGGVARVEKMPERPWDELFVAASGPAVNLVLAAAAFLLIWLGQPVLAIGLSGFAAEMTDLFLNWFMWTNVALLVFNLIPAFPMDGGRMLRALLGFKRDYLGATELAVKVGRFMAGLMALYSLYVSDFSLLLIAAFVWISGASELNHLRVREQMRRRQEGFDPQQVLQMLQGFGYSHLDSFLGQRPSSAQSPEFWEQYTSRAPKTPSSRPQARHSIHPQGPIIDVDQDGNVI